MLKCNFTLCVLIHDRDLEILPLGSAPLRHRLLWITAVSLVSPHCASGRCPNLQETARTPCQKSRWSRCGTWKSWFNKMLSSLGLCFAEVVNLQMGFDSRNHHGITSFFPLCILQCNNHCLTARMGCGAAHRLQPVSQAFGFESHGFPYRNRFKSQEPRAGKRESISKEFVVPDEQTAKTSWGTLLQRSPKYITSNLLKMMKHGFGR